MAHLGKWNAGLNLVAEYGDTCVDASMIYRWTRGLGWVNTGSAVPLGDEDQGDGKEVRITDPTTGGQKGKKPEEYALIPVGALAEIAKVYGYGAEKYESRNWEKSYAWSLSYSALQRHLNAFWGGEETDPESGLSHLAHAAFHVLALLTFVQEGIGTDDRSALR